MELADLEKWIEAHDGLAAWIQGIGTLAAIIFTIALAQEAVGREQREKNRAKAALLDLAAVTAMGIATAFVCRPKALTEVQDRIDQAVTRRGGTIDQLSLIPLLSWPDPALYERWEVFRRHLDKTLNLYEDVALNAAADLHVWKGEPGDIALRAKTPAAVLWERQIRLGWAAERVFMQCAEDLRRSGLTSPDDLVTPDLQLGFTALAGPQPDRTAVRPYRYRLLPRAPVEEPT